MPESAKLPDPRELQQAFSLFNEASSHLADAYQALQRQVEELAGQLAIANGELRRQFLEKEALSQRLSSLLAALPGGVAVLGGDGRVIEANPAALSLLGADLPGGDWREIAQTRLVAAATPHEWEVRGGEPRWVSIVESPLGGAGGKILLISDVTESYLMRQQLERHKRLSAMGEMAAGLAHQLRTPLATALLYTGNLARGGLSEDDRARFAEKALERLRHLEHMIRDMLLFVKGEITESEPVAVSSLLAELSQVIEPQMAQRGLRFAVSDESAGCVVLGSRKALAGALLNLLENAMQACARGGEVRLIAAGGEKWVTLQVADTGRGIGRETQERLFEPFFTTREEGTGLGLAIVRNVARAHGGETEVSSMLGKGTCFTMKLPKGAPQP